MKFILTVVFLAFVSVAMGQELNTQSTSEQPVFTKDKSGHLVRITPIKVQNTPSGFEKLFNFEPMATDNIYKLTTSHMVSEIKLHDLEGNEIPVKILSVGAADQQLGYLLEMSAPKGDYMFYAETDFEAWSTRIAIN